MRDNSPSKAARYGDDVTLIVKSLISAQNSTARDGSVGMLVAFTSANQWKYTGNLSRTFPYVLRPHRISTGRRAAHQHCPNHCRSAGGLKQPRHLGQGWGAVRHSATDLQQATGSIAVHATCQPALSPIRNPILGGGYLTPVVASHYRKCLRPHGMGLRLPIADEQPQWTLFSTRISWNGG